MANKMFNYFAGTKEQFIAKNYPTSHANEIVFIKGGGDASKSCIFAQGMYFANFAELLAAINYVKGISVGGQQYNAALGGGYVAFGAKDPSTIAVNAGQNGIEIGLTDTFVNKVNNTATNLGSSNDAASSTGSAFARIANLAAIVGQLTGSEGGDLESVEGQITKAINALRTEITGDLSDTTDAKTIEAINDELNDIVSRVGSLETDVNTIKGDYLKSTDKTELDGKIKTNTDAIAVLNGNNTVAGSVDKKIKDAIEAFAGTADGDNVIENVTELLNYVSGVDGSKTLASALTQIEENKGKIETLNGNSSTAGSVDKKVKDAIDAEVERANGAYATKAQGEKADTAYQKPSTGIAKTDLAEGVQTSLGKADSSIQDISFVSQSSAQTGKLSEYFKVTINDGSLVPELKGNAEVTFYTGYAAANIDGLATAQEVRAYVDSLWEWEELE